MANFTGQTAIVTGVSHANGIGAAICRKLAANGANIFFTHWQAEETWAESFIREISPTGVQCAGMEIDLSKMEDGNELLRHVADAIDYPAILVNNAAHSERDGYRTLDAAMLDAHYAVNVRAAMLLSTAFARLCETENIASGRIINMISGQGQGPMIEELAYGATKGAMAAFTLSLSAETAPIGMTVNAVNPGPTDTGWMTDEIKAGLLPKFLSGRIGKASDAANLVVFLASKDGAWVTGQVIHSEGGFYRC